MFPTAYSRHPKLIPDIVTGDILCFHNNLFKELEREGRPAAGRTPLKTLVNS